MSAPPISINSLPPLLPQVSLNVKLAFEAQILHMADNFLIFSQSGINSRILFHPFFSNVPLSALIMTILPILAAVSLKSTISGKN